MREANRAKKQQMDFILLTSVFILVCFGLLMVYSSSYYGAMLSKLSNYDGFYYLKKQLVGAIVGIALMFIISRVSYRSIKGFAMWGIIISLALLILVIIPGVGQTKNGATRWINVAGISVQPAEIAKFGMILFMATSITKKKNDILTFSKGVVPYVLLLGIACGLIMLQPNFSMIICIGATWLVMMFSGGVRVKHLMVLVVPLVIIGVVFASQGYRMERLNTFKDPWADPTDSGYQIIQSLYSIGSGGLFGLGLGNSRQKLLYLPMRESDFIFSIIAEELGFVGVAALLALFGIIIWRGFRIALNCPDKFGSMLATGITFAVLIQVLLNIAVATNTIPATGLTLPFVSFGSSSLIMMLIGVGTLLSVSRGCSPISVSASRARESRSKMAPQTRRQLPQKKIRVGDRY